VIIGAAIWRYGLTDFDPAHRLEGIAIGLLGLVIGVFLIRLARFAIVLSTIGAALVALAAVIAVPVLHGLVILAFAAIAIAAGLYAALAARALIDRTG
jgi:hypothetical protein